MNKNLLVVFLMSLVFNNFGANELYHGGCQPKWREAIERLVAQQERVANQDSYSAEFPGSGYNPSATNSPVPTRAASTASSAQGTPKAERKGQ